MNKQELIEKLKTIDGGYGSRYYIAMNDVFELVEQLDEPQKVTVPQYVADYIKDAKYYEWDLDDVFDHIAEESGESEISKWFYTLGNVDIFARAWLDGYEVEKEKRYTVKIKGISEKDCYLRLGRNTSLWFFGGFACDGSCEQTRKELEEAGFGEVFNSPLFEVEEVEE